MMETLSSRDTGPLPATELLSWIPHTMLGALGFGLVVVVSFAVGMLIQHRLSRRVNPPTNSTVVPKPIGDGTIREPLNFRQSDSRLRQLIDVVPALIFCADPDGEPSYVNRPLIDYAGLSIDDFETADGPRHVKAINSLIHPDERALVEQAWAISFSSGAPFNALYRQRRADGDYRWTDGRAAPLRGEDGEILQWIGVCLDIDDLVKAQDALKAREGELTQLIDTVPSLIWSMNADGEPTYFNRRLQDWLGFGIADLQTSGPGRRLQILDRIIHPDWVAQVGEEVGGALARGEPFTGKSPHRTGAGDYRWTETRLEPLRDAEGAILNWYGVMVDIDDEVRAQEALLTARERLARATQAASLAELSASIAHELNQPLSAVISNAQACQRWLAAEPPNLERARLTAERIVRQSNAASDVVNGIRGLFRQGPQAKAPTAIEGVITEVRDLMAAELRSHSATLSVEIEDNVPDVLMDRVQIQQVLVNLVRNGVEASEAGNLPITVTVTARGSDAGGVRVDVVDQGEGIEDPDRVFEAFFTTKASGMGMGLAICRSVIEAHQGRLWAEASEPRGARFSFTLPPVETVTV